MGNGGILVNRADCAEVFQRKSIFALRVGEVQVVGVLEDSVGLIDKLCGLLGGRENFRHTVFCICKVFVAEYVDFLSFLRHTQVVKDCVKG